MVMESVVNKIRLVGTEHANANDCWELQFSCASGTLKFFFLPNVAWAQAELRWSWKFIKINFDSMVDDIVSETNVLGGKDTILAIMFLFSTELQKYHYSKVVQYSGKEAADAIERE
jgi:hypothetical protein